ncbi:MAG: HAD family phosphatase [Anaerolineales bacterium]|jgi:HAD superfamily hydrolase (TIGR01509 family)
MNWSAVIFDLDGLMIDSEPIALEVWRELAAEHDREISEELYRQVIGHTPIFGVRHLRSALELPLSEEEILEEYWRRRTKLMCAKVKPVKGLVGLLELLQERGIAKAVASNSPRDYVTAVVESLGLSNFFKCVRSSEDVAEGKPAPDVYEDALRCLEIDSGSALVLEDSPAGVKAAKAAGLTCYAVPSHEMQSADFSEADEVIGSIAEIGLLFRERFEK